MKIKTQIHYADRAMSDMGLADADTGWADAILNLEHVSIAWQSPEDDETTQVEMCSGTTFTVNTPFAEIQKLMK